MKQVELEAILIQYPECLTDAGKLRAILLDLYPEASRGFIRVLCTVQSAGIVAEIGKRTKWMNRMPSAIAGFLRITMGCRASL